MKLGIVFICLLISFSAFTKTKWQKHYDIVNKDIQSVEALKTKDINLLVRLFELYGEKLTLLLEKENEYQLKVLEGTGKKRLSNILKLEGKVLRIIERVSKKIERQTKSSRILAKVYYYRALNFYLVKKYKLFYRNIKKAERINKDRKVAFAINTKLSDYYYNEKQYKKAERYYKKLLYKKDNKWLSRIHYNLAWSLLKNDKTGEALRYIVSAHKLSLNKNYIDLGSQIIDSVILFHSYAKRTKQGLRYIVKYKQDTFDVLLKYLHYVFENGNKRSAQLIISHMNSKKLTDDQKYQLLNKKIIVYRSLKKFHMMQKEFVKFRKGHSKKQKDVKQDNKDILVSSIRSYTGYLQELIKSKRYVKGKTKKRYVKYIAYNFNVLKKIDRKNELEYNYYEGETYFLMKNYKRAAFVYASGISKHKKIKGSSSNKFLSNSFDSLFKALENTKRPPRKILLFGFKSYLHFYPRSKKSLEIHKRLVSHYRDTGDQKRFLSSLRNYNKAFPKEIKNQRAFYKELLNRYIKSENIPAIYKLRDLVKRNFLKFPKSELLKITKIINQLYFSKYEKMAKKGEFVKAIAGFASLFDNDKNEYDIRYNALLKKMFYENKMLDYLGLYNSLESFVKFAKRKEKKINQEQMMYYAQNICVSELLEKCILVTNSIKKDKNMRISVELDNLSFKVYSIYNDVNETVFQKANTFERKNYLFKFLLMDDPNFTSPVYASMYKERKIRSLIDASVDEKFWQLFYNTLDLDSLTSFVNKLGVPYLSKNYINIISAFEKNLSSTNFILPDAPKTPSTTFEQFQAFNQNIEKNFLENVNAVNKSIQLIHPNFQPYYISLLIRNFDRESLKVKNYIPVSKDPDLEKAISDRILELSKILDLKLVEYRTLYANSLDRTQSHIGSNMYQESLMENANNLKLSGVTIWQE